jgi:hypothetical protein
MRDCDVRSALRNQLATAHCAEPNTLMLDELGICGRVRIDIAVVNGDLSGYEIKSAADDLRRLPIQVDVYSRVLDFACLVVASCHHASALDIIPDWWGVQVAQATSDSISLESIRPPERNDAVDGTFLVQLLWRDEALDELTIRDADRGVRSKARWHVWTRLAEVLTVDEMRAVVRSRLKARQDWRGVQSPLRGDET